MQYLLSIPISNAVDLLETTDYNITEIPPSWAMTTRCISARCLKSKRACPRTEYGKALSDKV